MRKTLHSNTLSSLHFLSVRPIRFGLNVSNNFICNRNDTCYSEKMPLFKRRNEETKREKNNDEFMKSTFVDVNKIKSLWIPFFSLLFSLEKNCPFSERVHLVVKSPRLDYIFCCRWCAAKWFCLLKFVSLLCCQMVMLLWFDLLKWPMNRIQLKR